MNVPDPTYPMGQSVRVVPGPGNNTPRRGTIRMAVWHHTDSCWDYYLRVCGRALSKRYRQEDLVPDAMDPAWLTPTVVALAEGIRAEGAFDRLPILADALEEAGCGDEDVLTHCRQPREHVDACWVIALLTSKG
jgi:hypothetical protein